MENTNENLNETSIKNLNEPKQRHVLVTAWCVLIIIINSFSALRSLGNTVDIINGSSILSGTYFWIITIVISIADIMVVIFAIMLLKWKKWSFWGLVILFICGFAIQIGSGINSAYFKLVEIAILYGILQIKKNGISAWKNLK